MRVNDGENHGSVRIHAIVLTKDRPEVLRRCIAAAGNRYDLNVVQEAIRDGARRGHIVQKLAPFFQRAVAGHDGGAVSVCGR